MLTTKIPGSQHVREVPQWILPSLVYLKNAGFCAWDGSCFFWRLRAFVFEEGFVSCIWPGAKDSLRRVYVIIDFRALGDGKANGNGVWVSVVALQDFRRMHALVLNIIITKVIIFLIMSFFNLHYSISKCYYIEPKGSNNCSSGFRMRGKQKGIPK